MIGTAVTPAGRDTARRLLTEYLLLPDAWPRHQPPAVLPAAMSRYVDAFPQPECSPPAGTVLTARAGNEQASGLLVVTALDQPVGHLSRLYVRPAARRRGLARALVRQAVRLAIEAPCHHLNLDVLPTRRAAITLYQSLGFTVIPTPPENPDGLIFMARAV